MNNQNQQNNNNNAPAFNNPFHLDPAHEDIQIERRLDQNMFCPLVSLTENFGEQNDYYSMRTIEPLKESFFHSIEALIFPNATFFQISSIVCYIITFIFLILLFFGLDDTNKDKFLQVKLSTVDTIGSFYPMKIKNNFWEYYRLLTFHFFHFNFGHVFMNIISLVSFCSYFELLVKKYHFILILLLTGIFSSLTCISFFEQNERYCGINADVVGIFGAFLMLFIMNWEECNILFGPMGRFLSAYLVSVYIFFNFIFYQISDIGNIVVQLIGLFYGAFIFAVLVKPIKVVRWKTFVRIGSGISLLIFTSSSMIHFHLKER
jgi:membrane associated rhomboid family serine protease